VPDAEATIPVISQLLALARARDARCLQPGHPPRRRSGVADLAQHGREGSWGWQIVDALAPADDETLPRKVCYDAFYGTPLDHLLRVWGVDTLMICGTLANICAHYTAASAALATS
jgi:nicotinamidase-related amidase